MSSTRESKPAHESGSKHKAPEGHHPAPGDYVLPANSPWSSAWKVSAVFALIGVVLTVIGALGAPDRFAFSWLFAFAVVMTLALGSLFFIITLHLVVGAWGITLRRLAEFMAASMPVLVLLFIPVAANVSRLYEWTHVEHEEHGERPGDDSAEHGASNELEGLFGASTARAQEQGAGGEPQQEQVHEQETAHAHTPMEEQLHHATLGHKKPYLNLTFFYLRALLYFAVWIGLAFLYYRSSTAQDTSRDLALTSRMQKWSPVAIIAFGLTLTFAAFDWFMSLEPAWYSTIYGVYVFASSAIAIYALLILIGLGLHARGHYKHAVTVEHFHDAGKMLFGFICFWAYIGFSQWMLIWYAGIPEEATFYHKRWAAEGWRGASLFLMGGHFALPFFFLMSRVVKRRLGMLGLGAGWMLFMHVVAMYWLIMPYATEGALAVHWLDVASLFAAAGIFFTAVFWIMRKHPLIPIGDPRLERALAHVQTT